MNTDDQHIEWRRGVRRVRLWLFSVVAVFIIIIALLVSVFRVVVPQVPAYRGEIVAWASDLLGAPVSIAELDLQWRWLRPELVLREVQFISADARNAVAVHEVRVAISLRTLVSQRRFTPVRILLVEPDATLVLDGGEGEIVGQDWRRAFGSTEHRGELVISRGRVSVSTDTGRRRIDLAALDMVISSDGTTHSVRATSRIEDPVGGLVQLRGDARGWPDQADFVATARIEARGVDLIGLQRLGRIGRLVAGRMDAAADLEVEGPVATRVAAQVNLESMAWPDGDPAHGVEHAAASVSWHRTEAGWAAAMDRLEVGRDGQAHTSGPIAIELAGTEWRIESGQVRLGDLVSIIEALPVDPAPGLRPLLDRAPGGNLENAMLVIMRDPASDLRYRFNATGSDLSLQPSGKTAVPGFDGVAATVQGDEQGGQFEIGIEDGALAWPDFFRDSLVVQQFAVSGLWTQGAEGWQLETSALELSNADLSLDASINIRRDAEGVGEVNANVDIHHALLAANGRYLPVGVMSETLAEWLESRVLAGVMERGAIAFRRQFGNSESEDVTALEATMTASGVEVNFADGWPVLEDAVLDARFTWDGFTTNVRSGRLAGTEVTRGIVGMETYGSRLLSVDAAGEGSLDQMLVDFRTTPVGRAAWLQQASAGGGGRLELQIGLDLAAGTNTIDGRLLLSDARFAVGGFNHALEALNGTLGITQDGFSAAGVSGTLLGEAVEVNAQTLRDGDGAARAIEIVLTGAAGPETLQQLTGNDSLPVSGRTTWRASLLAPYGGDQPPLLQVESDLVGMAVNLPDPLGKEPATQRALSMQVELGNDRRRVVIESPGYLRGDAVVVLDEADGWRLQRGRAHLGAGEAGPLPERDFTVTGRLSEWQIAVGRLTPTVAATEFPLTRVDVVIDELSAWGHALGEVALSGTRSDIGWYWMMDGEQVSGTLDLPDTPLPDSPVRADFARLNVPFARRAQDAEPVHADPRTLPPIAFYAGDLRIGVVHLGEVSGFLRPVADGVALESFTAHREEMDLRADATWSMVDGTHRTELRGTLESTDVQPTLQALGYSGGVDAANGHIEADLAWSDSPLVNPLPTLTGTFSLRMDRGALQDLDPGAPGRLFGMLSLNALPRRMALDFSDVYRRGLAFDTIQGSFQVVHGQAYTDDLILDGPAARVEIVGRTGLATRDYDQVATVVGSLASSLTLAGTLVGGPAVGAALLVVSNLLRGALEDMVSVRYHLSGSWEEPLVERLPDEPR